MAQRRTVLVFGDESAAGTRPLAELTAIEPNLASEQDDCLIWNPNAPAWQNLRPGVNTDPSSVAPSDRWGPEVRLRESIRAQVPGGRLFVVKHAKDSTLAHTGSKPSWSPHIAGSCFAELVTAITNAAAAAAAAGDSLRIEAFFVSLFTDDFKLAEAYLAYGANFETLISALRRVVPTIPHCALGSLNPSFSAIPAVVVEPAYKTRIAQDVQWKLTLGRGALTRLSQDLFQDIRILRSSAFAAAKDNRTFDAAAMVAIGDAFGPTVFETPPSWNGAAEADLAILMGDSICEGTGFNSQLPEPLRNALAGVNIWNDKVGGIQTLQAGVNNQTTLDPGGGLHGIEIRLGDLLRGSFPSVWLLKTAAPGSTSELWHPNTDRFFWHAMVVPWLRNMLDQMRSARKKPRLRLVSVCLGTNDVLNGRVDFAELRSCLRQIPERLRVLFAEQGLSSEECRFVFALPAATISPAAPRVMAARQAIAEVIAALANATSVDLNGIPTLENIHPNTEGTAAYARLVFKALADHSGGVPGGPAPVHP